MSRRSASTAQSSRSLASTGTPSAAWRQRRSGLDGDETWMDRSRVRGFCGRRRLRASARDGPILPADNVWFSCLTLNTNPIHFDAEYAGRTEFKKPLVNSCLTLALVTGQSTIDLTMNAVANLSWDEVRMPNPLLRGRYRLLEQRGARRARIEIASRRSGIVQVKTTGVNQHGATVIEFTRTFMVLEAGARAREASLLNFSTLNVLKSFKSHCR
mgnify:CR=1 FL=1